MIYKNCLKTEFTIPTELVPKLLQVAPGGSWCASTYLESKILQGTLGAVIRNVFSLPRHPNGFYDPPYPPSHPDRREAKARYRGVAKSF